MSPDDVVPLGKSTMYARRAVAEAWAAAGYPPINSATRLYREQKDLYDGWRAGWDGYAPADNPDDESMPLAHVRGVALDIDATPARVAALSAAGLVRPYSYEPWHWQLPGDVRRFSLITSFPTAAEPADELSEEDIMAGPIYINVPRGPRAVLDVSAGVFTPRTEEEAQVASALYAGKDVDQRQFDVAKNLTMGLHEQYIARVAVALGKA